jgi:uncharacterized sulfatase
MKNSRIIIAICVLLLANHKTIGQSKRPNILVILADDLGYATTGVYTNGKSKVQTPNIDKIAEDGTKFTDAYVTASVCGPSRSGLLTGRYQQRFGIYANFDTQRGPGVPGSEKVMGTYFKEAGYRTAAIGKWHIGVKEKGQHPIDRGFDKYYGFNSAQTDYFNSPILYDGKTKVKKHDYLTFQFTDEAVKFIEEDKKGEKPFFMYLAYNAVHGPNQAPKEYVAKYTAKGFDKRVATQLAMVDALDEGVGKVLKTLKDEGMEENTLVFFLSDNGGLPAWYKGSNSPWRGFKREQWEGGYHVQFLMKWPGKIPKATERKEMVYSLDILTTSLAAANIKKPKRIKLDGENIMSLFDGKKKTPLHKSLFWAGSHVERSGGAHKKKAKDLAYRKDDAPAAWTVRSGKWKLVQMTEFGEAQLFDLENDPTETTNLADSNKDLVKKLREEFGEWFQDMTTPIAWNKKYYKDLKKIK